MSRNLSLFTLVLAIAFAAPELHAQQQQQEQAVPGIVVVRSFECPLGNVSEAVEIMNRNWRPVAQEMIEEGRFLDYGILTHAWGDEWNVVDFFVSEDIVSFHQAFSEAAQRMGVLDSEGEAFERFVEICPRHKDNIYTFVPPAEDREAATP